MIRWAGAAAAQVAGLPRHLPDTLVDPGGMGPARRVRLDGGLESNVVTDRDLVIANEFRDAFTAGSFSSLTL